jgi:hypothetical protein
MSMQCPNCGGEVPDTAKVCGYCGTRLATAADVAAADRTVVLPEAGEEAGPEPGIRTRRDRGPLGTAVLVLAVAGAAVALLTGLQNLTCTFGWERGCENDLAEFWTFQFAPAVLFAVVAWTALRGRPGWWPVLLMPVGAALAIWGIVFVDPSYACGPAGAFFARDHGCGAAWITAGGLIAMLALFVVLAGLLAVRAVRER